MKLEHARTITKMIVYGTPIVWLSWDTCAEFAFGPVATESVCIREITARNPWFPLAYGFAMIFLYWHFFVAKGRIGGQP